MEQTERRKEQSYTQDELSAIATGGGSSRSVGRPRNENNVNAALIAAQLVAAEVQRGKNLTDYFQREQGALTDLLKNDDNLVRAMRIAKRLIELDKELQ